MRLGPDGKPQRTLLRTSPPPSSAGGPLRQKIVDKKTVEYEQYGQQIAALAQSYTQPDPQRLQQSYQQGDVTLGSTGAPSEVQLMISSYIKLNDSSGAGLQPSAEGASESPDFDVPQRSEGCGEDFRAVQ